MQLEKESCCIVCGNAFVEGEHLQAFLRCPEDMQGSWTDSVLVNDKYQERAYKHNDNIKRKHSECVVV